MILPEGALLTSAFRGKGGQIGVVVNVRQMEVGDIDEAGFDVGLLDFEGRATGPVLTAGSLKVAEIGDGDGGIQGSEDVPFPGGGRGGGCGVCGWGIGRGWSCSRDEGIGGNGS